MLLMEHVREIGVDQARINEDSIRVARQALTREMARSAKLDAVRRSRRRTWTWTGIGIGGLVAGTAVTAIVVGSVLAPVETPSAAAAEVLNQAADVAIAAGDIVVPAGEYLQIQSVAEGLQFWDVDMSEDEGWARFNNGARADAEAALLRQQSTSLYVPADRADEWVKMSEPSTIVDAYGDRADEARADAEKDPTRQDSERREVLRVAGGVYEDIDGIDGEGSVSQYLDGRQFWSEIPTTNPQELVSWLRARVGESPDSAASDSSIVETLTDDSTLALAPAEVRAAALRTLALLDGSSIESVNGDVTTIRFEWSTEWWTAWKLIDVDAKRGLIVGVTSSGAVTAASVAVEGLPEWDSRVSYDVSIVDSAP